MENEESREDRIKWIMSRVLVALGVIIMMFLGMLGGAQLGTIINHQVRSEMGIEQINQNLDELEQKMKSTGEALDSLKEEVEDLKADVESLQTQTTTIHILLRREGMP